MPLFLRFIIDAIRVYSEDFSDWYTSDENFAFTNTIFLILTTYLPILT